VARGRSDLGPNIPFKRLRILPGVMDVIITVRYCRQFPVLMRDRFCPLVFSLLLTAYKNGEGGLFQAQKNHLTRIASNTFPSHLLRAQREWESRPPKSPTAEIHLHGCAGDQIFGERLRDCSRDLLRLLPGDRSRDCTAYIFLHRLRTATSNKHTR
jgi:hypothetical protein